MAYDMRISVWSSDVCSSNPDGPNEPIFLARTFDVPDPHGDLPSGSNRTPPRTCGNPIQLGIRQPEERFCFTARSSRQPHHPQHHVAPCDIDRARPIDHRAARVAARPRRRSEEHTSELQSLMRISYAVFCLQKKKKPPEPLHVH